jgi:glucosyl-3-phosphoglycerate synthase
MVISDTEHKAKTTDVSDWFAQRTYVHDQFADIDGLARRKAELGLSLSVVLPAREVASTIGAIIDELLSLNDNLHGTPLVDQLLVIDAVSSDGTAAIAREHGADVYQESELVTEFGPVVGKGDAMWRSLSVAEGDLVAYLDSDTTDFGRHFLYGLLGPLLEDSALRFVKATYSRPFTAPDGRVLDDAGRVTELTAKPLFNAFFGELVGFGQPLAGEMIASRDLLRSLRFLTGYAVETAMLIDVLASVGLDAMAQVDLGVRHNRYQPLFALGAMSYSVLRAVLLRADASLGCASAGGDTHPAARAAGRDCYMHAYCPAGGVRLEERLVRIVERPPMAEID